MAVLDGHHDASDPTDPVGSALGKIMRALPEPVAAQAEAVRPTTAPAPDRAAARPDPGTTTALVQACSDRRRVRLGYRSEAGVGVGRRGRPVGGRRPPRPVVPAVPRRTPPDARRAYRIDRVRAVRGARRHASARRPTSTRSPCSRSTSRSAGSTTSRWSSTPRSRGGAVCSAHPRPARAARRRDHPAGRQHQQPALVRRAAGRDPGARTGSCAAPSCRTRPGSSVAARSPPPAAERGAGRRRDGVIDGPRTGT